MNDGLMMTMEYNDWILCNGQWTDDYFEIPCFEDSKTYALCMIFTCYVIYVIIVDHALIVKFYSILVCLF